MPDRAQKPRQLGFGKRPALVAVDLTNAFTHPGGSFGCELSSQIDSLQRLLRAMREHGLPVYFTAVAYDDPDLADAGLWKIKLPALQKLRAGTAAAQLDNRIGRLSGEPLMVKRCASAFFGTPLAEELRAGEVDTLIVTGCTTSGCVRATVVDAIQHGFRPIVVPEAVGDRDLQAHVQSLRDMDAKYADVVPLERALAALRSLRHEAAPAAF